MDFEKIVYGELDEKYIAMLTKETISPILNDSIIDYQVYKDNNKRYHRRITNELKEYNEALSLIKKRKDYRSMSEKKARDIAFEKRMLRKFKFQKTLILILLAFTSLLIAYDLFSNYKLYSFRTNSLGPLIIIGLVIYLLAVIFIAKKILKGSFSRDEFYTKKTTERESVIKDGYYINYELNKKRKRYTIIVILFVFTLCMANILCSNMDFCNYFAIYKPYKYDHQVYISQVYEDLEGHFVIPSRYKDKKVIGIANSAFKNCNSLTSIIIPNSVINIEDYAFQNCTSLTSITIPESVTSIGDYTFKNCTSLTSITVPESVTSIGDYAFQNCTSLTSITIPESVTSIGDYTFQNCTSLTSITIPESVTSIGDYAFQNCTSLESIVIPDSVMYIRDYAFANCSNLTIYCEREYKYSFWSGKWNYSSCPVVWGYKEN